MSGTLVCTTRNKKGLIEFMIIAIQFSTSCMCSFTFLYKQRYDAQDGHVFSFKNRRKRLLARPRGQQIKK